MNTKYQVTQSTKGFNIIFIHSSLDDAELTPGQFRVFAHISRRAGDGEAWGSIEGISKTCRMSEKHVRSCLHDLLALGLLEMTERPGKTSLWRVTSPDEWNLQKQVNNNGVGRPKSHINPSPTIPGVLNYPSPTIPGDPSPTIPGDPSPTIPPEGYPCKGIQQVYPFSCKSEPALGDSGTRGAPSPKRALTDGYVEAYREAMGTPYLFGGAKDGKAADRLLTLGVPVPDILSVVRAALKHRDWFHCRQAVTLAGFAAAYNGIRNELATKNTVSTNFQAVKVQARSKFL